MKYPFITFVLSSNKHVTLKEDKELQDLINEQDSVWDEVFAFIWDYGTPEEKEELKRIDKIVNDSISGAIDMSHSKDLTKMIEFAFRAGHEASEGSESDFVFAYDPISVTYLVFPKSNLQEIKKSIKDATDLVNNSFPGSTFRKRRERNKLKEEKRKRIGSQ